MSFWAQSVAPATKRFLKILWTVIVVLIIITLLVACGEPAPEEGTIVDRQFEAAHWESGYRTEYRTEFKCKTVTDYFNGQTRSRQQCGTESVPYQVYESHHYHVDDRWRFKLRKCSEDNDCKTGWRTISEYEFETYDMGDYYPKEGKR